MKDIVERFISYTKIDTTSVDDSKICPSSYNQFTLANQLEKELKQLGVENAHVDEKCFVYGFIPANTEKPCNVVGLLAHMDTSNATSGKDIKARVIKNYDGGDIELSKGIYTTVEEYPQIKALKGKDIIVTDGTTLLGADDKAGIAIIMDTIQTLVNNPEIKHGDIRVCFTPDEEIGSGISNIDLNEFKCDFAYTVDGGEINAIDYETFNAASAHVIVHGNSIHPGSAKGKMINAIQVAMDFHGMLPVFDRPENTEGREGFNHIVGINGGCEQADSFYIIRNHDADLLEKQKKQFEYIKDHINNMYGKEIVEVDIRDSYRNMKEAFDDKMYIIELADKAISDAGYVPVSTPVRGGTDGSQLTFMGIPTPNLGTGGLFCHGNHEMLCIDDMKAMVKIVINLLGNIVEKGL